MKEDNVFVRLWTLRMRRTIVLMLEARPEVKHRIDDWPLWWWTSCWAARPNRMHMRRMWLMLERWRWLWIRAICSHIGGGWLLWRCHFHIELLRLRRSAFMHNWMLCRWRRCLSMLRWRSSCWCYDGYWRWYNDNSSSWCSGCSHNNGRWHGGGRCNNCGSWRWWYRGHAKRWQLFMDHRRLVMVGIDTDGGIDTGRRSRLVCRWHHLHHWNGEG